MPSAIAIAAARVTVRSRATRVRQYDDAGLVGVVPTAAALVAAASRGARATLFPGAGPDGADQLVIQPFPGRRGSPTRFVVDLAAAA